MENNQFDYEKLKEHIQNLIKSLEQSLTDNSKETKEKLDVYVKENPWHAMGVTLLIGLIIGLLFGHSKKEKKHDER